MRVDRDEVEVDKELATDLRKAQIYFRSGLFGLRSVEEAFSRIRLGRELGIGETTALRELYVMNGRLAMSATVISALINRSGRCRYRVKRLDNTCAEVEFLRDGEVIGTSAFSMEDAKLAGLVDRDSYRRYPRNMLLSRALANGARWHCPEIFVGSVYLPEEVSDEGSSSGLSKEELQDGQETAPAACGGVSDGAEL